MTKCDDSLNDSPTEAQVERVALLRETDGALRECIDGLRYYEKLEPEGFKAQICLKRLAALGYGNTDNKEDL